MNYKKLSICMFFHDLYGACGFLKICGSEMDTWYSFNRFTENFIILVELPVDQYWMGNLLQR